MFYLYQILVWKFPSVSDTRRHGSCCSFDSYRDCISRVSHHCCNSVCIVLEGNIMITTRLGIWDNGPCYAMSFVQSTTGHAASIKFHTEVQPTKAQHISESQKRNPTPRSAMKIKVSLFSSFFSYGFNGSFQSNSLLCARSPCEPNKRMKFDNESRRVYKCVGLNWESCNLVYLYY